MYRLLTKISASHKNIYRFIACFYLNVFFVFFLASSVLRCSLSLSRGAVPYTVTVGINCNRNAVTNCSIANLPSHQCKLYIYIYCIVSLDKFRYLLSVHDQSYLGVLVYFMSPFLICVLTLPSSFSFSLPLSLSLSLPLSLSQVMAPIPSVPPPYLLAIIHSDWKHMINMATPTPLCHSSMLNQVS